MKRDNWNYTLLVLLYSLQGLVIGLLLQTFQLRLKNDFSYSEIGVFLLCSYPFSLKILWAPIVDTYYIKSIGLRKTWIIFTQIIGGMIVFYLSYNANQIIKEKNIIFLTIISFSLMFVVATQDIAVDGWALSMSGKDNVTMQSSSQTIGQIIGVFISTTIFINLNTESFCNEYLYFLKFDRENTGPILTLEVFLILVSFAFFFATFIIFFVKEEKDRDDPESIAVTFKKIKFMVKNKSLGHFIFLMLFARVGHIFSNKIVDLILVEKGLSQQTLTNVGSLLIPFEIWLSYNFSNLDKNFLLTKLNQGYKNLILIHILELLFLFFFDTIKDLNYFFTILLILLLSVIKTNFLLLCHTTICGFFCKICDNRIGGTYITYLNTMHNLSDKLPGIFIFVLVDKLGYQFTGIISILYSIAYFTLTKRKYKQLEVKEETEWLIDLK